MFDAFGTHDSMCKSQRNAFCAMIEDGFDGANDAVGRHDFIVYQNNIFVFDIANER